MNLISVSNNLFRRADNNDLVSFREENGKVKYVFFNNAPYDSFERVHLKDSYKLNLGVFVIALVFFMYQILKNIFLSIKNLFKKKSICNCEESKSFKANKSKSFKLMIFVISFMNIIALVGVLYWMISFDMYYSVTWYMKVSLVLFIVSTIFVVASSIVFFLSIKNEKTKLSYKIFGFFSLAILYAFTVFLCNWNLMEFRL